MIVGERIVTAVKAKRATRLWAPATRGDLGERLRPFDVGQVVSLQPRAGVGGVRVTVAEAPVLTSFAVLDHADARRAGFAGRADALRDWSERHGAPTDDALLWSLAIVLGDRSEFFEQHAERYLRAKMGGGRAYTTIPEQGVRGEGAVPAAELATYAARARENRETEQHARLRAALCSIEDAITSLQGDTLSTDTRKELAWMQRRAAKLAQRVAA